MACHAERSLKRYSQKRYFGPTSPSQPWHSTEVRPTNARASEITKHLSAVAAAGLQALDCLQAGQHAPAGWTEQQIALLDRAKRPKGELLLSVEPPIRKLIEAAR
jgi:hypothetical protein